MRITKYEHTFLNILESFFYHPCTFFIQLCFFLYKFVILSDTSDYIVFVFFVVNLFICLALYFLFVYVSRVDVCLYFFRLFHCPPVCLSIYQFVYIQSNSVRTKSPGLAKSVRYSSVLFGTKLLRYYCSL